jgi:hypothetical protein
MSPALLLQLAPWLAAAAAGAALSAAATWPLARAPLQTALADLREDHAALRISYAESARLAALAAAARLQAAQQRSSALGAQLSTTLAQNARLTKEKTDALNAATTGRACLSDRALRVLHGAPGLAVTGLAGVPAPGARAAAAGAAPAAPADPARPDGARAELPAAPAAQPPALEATDTAVAIWIATAGEQHEACRERLAALIAWHENPPTQEPRQEPAP